MVKTRHHHQDAYGLVVAFGNYNKYQLESHVFRLL